MEQDTYLGSAALNLRLFAAEGIAARLSLAIIESVGIMYANVGPVIVSGLAQREAFDAETAGYVLATNMYGMTLGGLVVLLLLKRLSWRPAATGLLLTLILIDLVTLLAQEPLTMYALRFLHGLTGGLLVGISLSVIARIPSPERTIGLAVGVQLGFGGLLSAVATPLLSTYGLQLVWCACIVMGISGLVLLQFLGPYAVKERSDQQGLVAKRAGMVYIILVMLGIVLFQLGEMGAFAYVIELGSAHEFSDRFIGLTLATGLWTGVPAALFVTWWGIRSGRLRPLLASTITCALAIAALTIPSPTTYFIASILFAMGFSIAISYMIGLGSELDNLGRMGAMAGLVSNLGLAIGPAAGGFLAGRGMLSHVFILGAVLVLTAAVMLLIPARMLDRRNFTGRVRW